MSTTSVHDNFSLEDVVFADATPEQRVLAWRLNGASWAEPMTIDEYVGREQTLAQTELSRNGGTKYYVLYHRDDPNVILSSCEATSKKVLIADSQGSRISDAYSIASVFTDPRYRQHGLASHMLRELQKAVDETTECGALYSDIGRKYYTRLGWRDARSPQVALKMDPDFQPPPMSSQASVSLLTGDQVSALCDKDISALEKKFETLAELKDGNTHIAFVPSFTQCSWHFARDAYVARVVLQREPQYSGAATADGASWLYWDHDVREKKLKILRIVLTETDSPEKQTADARALLEAALREASDWGIPTVLVWDPNHHVTTATTDIWRESGPKLHLVFDERESGSIPSLRWRNGQEISNLKWEANEYYAWC
ncbi:Lysine acetyltransferase [Paramyrothecium foliicola]|nr:Lysine acetyltransferase [Paramyrothecium foliicola]